MKGADRSVPKRGHRVVTPRDDALFHLGGGVVRERDQQYVLGLVALPKQIRIPARDGEGLARPRPGVDDVNPLGRLDQLALPGVRRGLSHRHPPRLAAGHDGSRDPG